jgi:hypothetical protein
MDQDHHINQGRIRVLKKGTQTAVQKWLTIASVLLPAMLQAEAISWDEASQ